MDNGISLRKLIESTGMTQDEALMLFNKGQVRPIATSTWKAYLAGTESKRRRACPDSILEHARKVLTKHAKLS